MHDNEISKVKELPAQIADLIQELIRDLVAGEYEKIEGSGRAKRCEAGDIRRVVEAYGENLIEIPFSALQEMDVYPHDGGRSWSIDVDLYSRESGRSDLTLQLTVITDETAYLIEIDDLHVL